MTAWAIIVGFTVALIAALAVGQRLALARGWAPESSRKLVHVAMALACLSFPWLFDESWPVGVIAGFSIIILLGVRTVPWLRTRLGAALHGVERPSMGELFFPAGVAFVFHLAGGNKALYLAPLLVLGVADAAGALCGKRFGRTPYHTTGGTKSCEGTFACFLAAWVCGALVLKGCSDAGWDRALLIGLNLALVAAFAEGVLAGGLDNLLLPVATFALVKLQLPLPMGQLFPRTGIIVLVFAALLVFKKRASFTGGGVLLAVLFGYVCYALGGLDWLAVGSLVYGLHLVNVRSAQVLPPLRHGPDAVTAVALTALVWIVAHRAAWLGEPHVFLGFGCSLACSAVMMAHRRSSRWLWPLAHGLLVYGTAVALRWPQISAAPAWPALLVLPPLALAVLLAWFDRWRAVNDALTPGAWLARVLLNASFSATPLFALLFDRP